MASSITHHLLGFKGNPNTCHHMNNHSTKPFHFMQAHHSVHFPLIYKSPISLNLLQTKAAYTGTFSGSGDGGNGDHGDGGNNNDNNSGDGSDSSSDEPSSSFPILGLVINGWRSRVLADPEFPFKVLMEELVGVSANVAGDMASRPNFGLNELDLVFSTLVVGAILNFLLMYILAPTSSPTSSSSMFSIFSTCPKSHMFEPGAYTIADRFGTFVFKGAVFAVVGFAAGLVGTAISSGLVKMRKKMDPSFETGNKAPPTVLNALTWAAHMGVSCNLRYQSLNGIEYVLAKGLPPLGFKASVLVLRCLNNVMGGVSFVWLARLTGSQSQAPVNKVEDSESQEQSIDHLPVLTK